jgi:hypothetical protein
VIYRYLDPSGDRLEIEGVARGDDSFIAIDAYERDGTWTTIHVPLDQVNDLIAGIRNAAANPAA